jgi:transposase InsO family protein
VPAMRLNEPRRPLVFHLPKAVKTPLEKLALRALRQATHLFGLMFAQRVRELRASDDPVLVAMAQALEHEALARLLDEVIDILGERWDKIPDRRRPHYTPVQRARILAIKHMLALSRRETARVFRVSPDAVAAWEQEATREPDKTTIGNTVKPVPPVRRYADVVRHMVRWMDFMGFGSERTIASTLARAGWKIGKTTVARYTKRPFVPLPEARRSAREHVPLEVRGPHHVWIMDTTRVPALFGVSDYFIVAVFDAFSRVPLAVRTFEAMPLAKDTLAVLQEAVAVFSPPRHLATDRGEEFDAGTFKDGVRRMGIKQRFDSPGKHSITARLERFWRTLKHTARLKLRRPLTQEDLDCRLRFALEHYAFHRPHRGLGGATPAEVQLGRRPAHLDAVNPPRGRPGEGPVSAPFGVEFLDPDQIYPVLKQVA